MIELGLLQDERYQRHHTGAGHPERPQRLAAIRDGLRQAGFEDRCLVLQPELLPESIIAWVHSAEYLRRLESACRQGWSYVDVPDCAIGPDSYEIARLAAGGVVAAVRAVATGRVRRAFCAVRPPAHHAEVDRAMGFCLLNSVAIAARVWQREFGVQRVLILDWDVHHGNGTQHIFEADPSVLYVSLHGHPAYLYPGTGYAEETGQGPGRGYTVNVPLLPGAGDADFQRAFDDQVVPAVERYAPQAVIVSAGFDAHSEDPLGNLDLTDACFCWVTERLLAVVGHLTDGRLVSVLEGGYHLAALQRCVVEHVRVLAGEV